MSDTTNNSDSASQIESSDADSGLNAPSASTTNDNSEGVVQSTPAEQKLSRKLKLKIDGQEVEETLPFDFDENNKEHVDYLKRQLQLAKVAQKRMNESSLTRKQAEQFINVLKTDPLKILSDDRIMGQSKFRQIAEQFLLQQIEAESMSPEQRKQKEMESKLKTYEQREADEKRKHEEARIQQLEAHYAQQYEKTIVSALESSQLPKNPFTVRRMAELLQKNIQHGLDLDPSVLAGMVKEDYQKELVSLIGGSNADQILSMFGEDVATKIRKADLEKLKSNTNNVKPNTTKPTATQSDKPMTMSEWRRLNGHG